MVLAEAFRPGQKDSSMLGVENKARVVPPASEPQSKQERAIREKEVTAFMEGNQGICVKATNGDEDAMQDAWFAAWKHWDRFDSSRGKRESWVYTIAEHKYTDRIRKQNRINGRLEALPRNEDMDMYPNPDAFDPEAAAVSRADNGKKLGWAWDRLNAYERQMTFLIGVEQMTFAEAAEALGWPIGTFKTRYQRMRVQINEKFRNASETDIYTYTNGHSQK